MKPKPAPVWLECVIVGGMILLTLLLAGPVVLEWIS
jgi:hypothetical protein